MRHKLLHIALTVILTVFISASAGATDDSTADESQDQATQNDDELICRMERPVGSRIRHRVCRTRAQMEREREEAQDFIDQANSREAQIYVVPD